MKSCSRILSGAIALLALASPGCGGGGGAGPDRSPPRVIATIPPAGASGVAVDLAIAAVFDEELWPPSVDGTKFTLTDEQGAAVAGSVSYGQRTAVFLPHTPLAWSTQHTAVLHAGVEDLARNPLLQDVSWSFTTAANPDATPPEVLLTAPLDGALDVALDATLQAWFSEPMAPATLDGASFLLADAAGAPVPGSVSCSGSVATFAPAAALDGFELYRATITTGARDLAGNPLASEHSWTFRTVAPAPGSIDRSFGQQGIAITSLSDNNDWANGLIVQPDGRILALGMAGGSSPVLVRYLADGALDPLFGSGGVLWVPLPAASCLALQPDGKIVVGGRANIAGSHIGLVRFDAAGALDTGFGLLGFVTTDLGGFHGDWASALLVQPDGRIALAGGVGTSSGSDSVLVRYTASGGLDPDFGEGGVRIVAAGPANDAFTALEQQADGKLLAAGSVDRNGLDFAIARFEADGGLDEGFGTGGLVLDDLGSPFDEAFLLAREPGGKLLVAGRALGSTGYDVAVARYWP